MCDVMKKLMQIEKSERSKCHEAGDIHVQMFHGQAVLEAQRIQELHQTRCAECRQDDAAHTREAAA